MTRPLLQRLLQRVRPVPGDAPASGTPGRVRDLSFIRAYRFPADIFDPVDPDRVARPDHASVEVGLRQLFTAAAVDPDLVAMSPSKLVSDAWQRLAERSELYAEFCHRAFGEELPLWPFPGPEGLSTLKAVDLPKSALWATWVRACQAEDLHPERTAVAPTLFDVDLACGAWYAKKYIAKCTAGQGCSAKGRIVCVFHTVNGVPVPTSKDARRAAWRFHDAKYERRRRNGPAATRGQLM